MDFDLVKECYYTKHYCATELQQVRSAIILNTIVLQNYRLHQFNTFGTWKCVKFSSMYEFYEMPIIISPSWVNSKI